MPQSDEVSSYDHFYDRATWDKLFVVWPRRCVFTRKWLWLESAYRSTRVYTGPGEPIIERRWVQRHEFMLQRLRGRI